jgi:2'-5' RNA ligase
MLPEKGPKRTVVVVCDRPRELLELHRRLVQRFARYSRMPADTDRFLPHLTLARFSGAGAEVPPERRVDRRVELPEFEVGEVHLLTSLLKPEGAEHHELLGLRLYAEAVRR